MRVHLFTSSWLIPIFFFSCSGLQFSRSFLFSHYLSFIYFIFVSNLFFFLFVPSNSSSWFLFIFSSLLLPSRLRSSVPVPLYPPTFPFFYIRFLYILLPSFFLLSSAYPCECVFFTLQICHLAYDPCSYLKHWLLQPPNCDIRTAEHHVKDRSLLFFFFAYKYRIEYLYNRI